MKELWPFLLLLALLVLAGSADLLTRPPDWLNSVNIPGADYTSDPGLPAHSIR